jgi:hypothetical protein
VCCVALATACGDSGGADPGSSALGDSGVKLTVREASCTDWNDASVDERQVIVDSLAEFESGEPTGTVGRTLPDDEAYALFDRACDEEYARAFKLYKVYVRAAAFTESQ